MKKEIIKGYILSASAGIVVALFLALILMHQIYNASQRERLQSIIIVFASGFDADQPDEQLQAQMAALHTELTATDQTIRFTVMDLDARVLVDSNEAFVSPGDLRIDRPEVQDAMEEGWGFHTRFSESSGRRYLYAATRIGDYIYRAALPADEIQTITRLLMLSFFLCMAVGIGIALLLGRRLASRLIQPVLSLTEATKGMASGRFDKHVGDYPSELGELGRSFNKMASHLEVATGELKRQNERLHSIISGIEDGIIALQGEILHPFLLTEQAVKMLGPFSGRYESLESYGTNYMKLSHIVRKARGSNQPVREVLELSYPHETILNVYAASFGQPDDMNFVVVLRDITRVTKLEQMRSEFVANVTHELKTPLTSIRGYIQLLSSAERDEKTRASFYEIIEIETDRLMILISDLLDLSEIESRSKSGTDQRSEPQYCSFYDVMEEVKEQIEPIALARDISLFIDVPQDLGVQAEYKRMKQLMSNLVSNAVTYNHPGGSVWVSAIKERDMVSIHVKDDGIGIPAEHQERIFERFYRVSKDRSRELGGTGLGLSIAKHIVNLYDGSITLESEVGRGSVFLIRLPQARYNG